MGAPAKKSGKAAREERESILILKHKFENRITIAKFGKEALDNGDYANALRRFNEYLNIVAEVKKVRDLYSIRVQHFDPKKEVTEILMISHIFFEMARLYDAVPKYHEDCRKCLEQFVHFSVNQPFQVVNSELVRKYLKKSSLRNPDDFRNAYQQIYVQSKKCYVVTYCFGEDHAVTGEFRKLKDSMLESSSGREFVRIYYRFSSHAVERWAENALAKISGRYVARPMLHLFAKTVLRLIIK